MNWIDEEEYLKQTGLEIHDIEDLISSGKIKIKIEDDKRYIEATDMSKPIATLKDLSSSNTKEMVAQPEFVEKTIGTIISLHEKVLDAKDETIAQIKEENKFLKEALESLQEIYEEDRKTIKTLQTQLELSQQEVEFLRRKYKLMWNKAVDEHKD